MAQSSTAPIQQPKTAAPAGKKAEQEFWEAVHGKDAPPAARSYRRLAFVGAAVGGLAIASGLGFFLWRSVKPPEKAAPAASVQIALAPTPAPAPAIRPIALPPAVVAVPNAPRASDGASLVIAGMSIRLQGIEAPPATFICRAKSVEFNCGEAARRALDGQIGGAKVDCTRPAGIATCRNHRGLDIASLQVESGWALATPSGTYQTEQNRAKAKGAGLWRDGFARPDLWNQVP